LIATHKAMALMGATGTGKSALALEVAQATGASIISCDSMQVYRGLDIGTAKVSCEERALVPHHLVDCADIQDIWSAQHWADAALDIIRSENAAGRVPLIVGGTGMYLRALLEGFAAIPEVPQAMRDELLALQQAYGTAYLHQQLQACDPDLAQRLHASDSQRIMRGLGVFQASQKPLSAWQAEHQQQHEAVDCPVFVLEVERSVLRERLAARIEAMLQAGWVDEVRWLDAQQVPELHPALRAVGYRQLLDYVHGVCNLEEAKTDAITATRRYAKRQVTWFRNQTPHAQHGSAEDIKTALLESFKAWI